MGDRTYVILTILHAHKDLAEPVMEDWDEEHQDAHLHNYHYYEVNYGNLSFLGELEKLGIPYDSSWDDGDDYGSGTKSCRFTPDEMIIKEIYDADDNPSMKLLMELIDNPVGLRQIILDHKEKRTPLPIEDQEENVRLFKTRKLITT